MFFRYWAPNIWALYNFGDIILCKFFGNNEGSALTRGLVGEYTTLILPTIKPYHTMILTLIFMFPILINIWKQPNPKLFLPGLFVCYFIF